MFILSTITAQCALCKTFGLFSSLSVTFSKTISPAGKSKWTQYTRSANDHVSKVDVLVLPTARRPCRFSSVDGFVCFYGLDNCWQHAAVTARPLSTSSSSQTPTPPWTREICYIVMAHNKRRRTSRSFRGQTYVSNLRQAIYFCTHDQNLTVFLLSKKLWKPTSCLNDIHWSHYQQFMSGTEVSYTSL